MATNGKRNSSSVRNRVAPYPAPERFSVWRKTYEAKWGVRLAILDDEGERISGKLPPGGDTADAKRLFRAQMREALRWGETPFELLPDGSMVWIAPLMRNQRLTGAVLAHISRRNLFADDDEDPRVDVHRAATELLAILVEENDTNEAYLQARRDSYISERRRAEAIHAFKTYAPDFRNVYIRHEPALMAAIRRGDREEARSLLNDILVVLHAQAGDNLALVKSFFLEIVTLMCRAAVEAGCEANELLGKNYEAFSVLSRIASDDELGPWLHEMLERLIDAIHSNRNATPMAQLQSAMAFMHENLHRDIGRDDAARAAHLSPAHFSRIFKKEMRESFTDMLNRMRVDHAATLLAGTDRSLAVVALDCGFKDQSYFTKIFRKYMRLTPRSYRLRLAAARKNAGRG